MLATWCEELTHLKRRWCWERLTVGVEGDDRGWDGWMASPNQWTWVWVGSGSWWWTGKPDVLQSMGSQRIRHDWATELNSVTPWVAAHQAPLSFTISQSFLKFMLLESMILSNHLILCHSPFPYLQSLPAWGSFPTSGLFASGGQSIGASASASVLPGNFRVDFL